MASTPDGRSEAIHETKPALPESRLPVTPPAPSAAGSGPHAATGPQRRAGRRWLWLAVGAGGLAIGLYFLMPTIIIMLTTVSTDDAYVNGHVTFVAPRVAGQVSHVFVDDNNRVKKGDKLVELDKEPYQVQVALKKAAVEVAQTNLAAARAQVASLVGQTRSNRFKLEHAMEEVKNQIANLRASVAAYNSRKATVERARADLRRGEDLINTGGISKEALDERKEAVKVAEAAAEQALQTVYAIRVGLGLTSRPTKGDDLTEIKPDLEQNYSAVRQALAETMQSAAQIGYTSKSWNATPKQVIEEFYKRDPEGNLDRIYAQLMPQAPAVKQAEAKLEEARRDLAQAELNLRYCDVRSEIDGVVTRRNVNPGNNVQVGQNLMAVRSLTEIWIDANFKETQLADLRIGQRVRLEVDMYGSRREFEGRISGFTMGTGSTLALLPPQNATGNFVKVVQRLPVRIELTDYDPEQGPLFVGLSVAPYVYYREKPTGDDAGKVLQPYAPPGPQESKP
jgi:membrane fusion protein (multidrug efflux system)